MPHKKSSAKVIPLDWLTIKNFTLADSRQAVKRVRPCFRGLPGIFAERGPWVVMYRTVLAAPSDDVKFVLDTVAELIAAA